MLSEWLAWLTTSCPPQARRLGHLRESIAIRARHQRCAPAWRPHLERSREALLTSLNACDRHRAALVFGSGLLLDVPLDELAQRFERVLLIDVVHLPEARRAARRYANVHSIEHDATGFFEQMDTLTPDALNLPPPARFLDDATVDWVASVNLVSQLPLLPSAWLARRFPALDEPTLAAWGRRLMRQHLDYLAAFDAPACALADLEQTVYDRDGAALETTAFSDVLNIETNRMIDSWRWDVAPVGEIAKGIGSFHRVVAMEIGKAGRA